MAYHVVLRQLPKDLGRFVVNEFELYPILYRFHCPFSETLVLCTAHPPATL